ncbi:hypothetical protein BKA56DRAFT_672996 [Ilyonectria sp. MPI-CAGE-AT-0026]|nr:hypothetical protein BKA56DRAFT_672996 [Ilyonectria sp. MPI-CAGE-AT-0026]
MGRLSQLRNNLGGISLWVLSAAFTAACFVLQNAPYLRVYLTEECDKLTSPSQWRTYVLLLVNVAAAIPTAAATHFRTGLLAPPKATYQPGKRKYIGIDTLTGFKAATLFRQILYVFLLLTPLPVFFLSNSFLFIASPAYNSYELVVSTSFFDGNHFDLSNLTMTRFPMGEEQTMPSRDLPWPAAYGGVEWLNQSLADLQQDPRIWTNLSRNECLGEFNSARYENYRTLLLVTDFDQGNDSPLPNNSALAVGVLPGYRLTSASSSLVALCPDAYLEAYPRVETPETAPLMPQDLDWRPFEFEYADPAEAEAWVTRNSSISKRRWQAITEYTRDSTSDPMPRLDLCYQYWADADKWKLEDGNRTYMAPRADLKYCLAEPMTGQTCQVISSHTVLLALAIILSVMLCAMTGALFLRLWEEGVYTCKEAEECFPAWNHEGWCGRGRFKDSPWPSDLLYLVLFIYIWVLWGTAGHESNGELHNADLGDDTWLSKASVKYTMIHILYEVVWFFHLNAYKRREQRNTDPLRASWRGYLVEIFLGLVKTMMHFAFTLTFVHDLYIVMPLESSPGTLDNGVFTSATILGISTFNSRDSLAIFGFVWFSTVFVFLPTAIVDGLLCWVTSLDMKEIGHSSWMQLNPLMFFVMAVDWYKYRKG